LGVYTGSGPTDPVVGNKVSTTAFGVPTSDAIQALASATTSYTPSWTASTTNPTIGNGTITGAYTQIGKMVFVRIQITMGSTTTYGSGQYSISLPVAPVATQAIQALLTDDSGAVRYDGVCWLTTGTGIFRIVVGYTASAGMTATSPITLATSDSLVITGWYEGS
jgi:hypothetical protein